MSDDATRVDADIGSYFATPIVTATLPQIEALNQELAELFLSKEKDGDKHRNPMRIPTQVGDVFESSFDLFNWPDPPVRTLARACNVLLRDLIATVNEYDAEQMRGLTFHYHSWFHITRYGGYQSIHYHPDASWSGIYCVCPGDAVEGRPESGAVKFYDPRGAAFMHVDPGNERFVPGFNTRPVYFIHKAGQLVMFPSWLMHEVLPYVGQTERIVVAYNAWVKRQQ
ncbi:MAG: TIGR02466 family protein [Acidiferrobacterales bacterium]